VSREEHIFEFSNAKMESAAMEGKELELTSLNSDPENAKEQNTVEYHCNQNNAISSKSERGVGLRCCEYYYRRPGVSACLYCATIY